MTEVTFHRKSFIQTLDVLTSKFELADPSIVLETQPSATDFILIAKRKNGMEVRAYGTCTVKGEPVNVAFDLPDLKKAIADSASADEQLTLLVGNGLWVKEGSAELNQSAEGEDA